MENNRTRNKRTTIGLVLDNLRRNSSSLFWSTMVDDCRILDVNLVIIPGECIRSNKTFAYQHNVMYDFIDETLLDGLIFVTNSLGDFVESESLTEVYADYLKLPFVSINIDLEGAISTISCDNHKGIRTAMNHLIVLHGYKKIGFIQGQMTHKDAIERFKAYKSSLADHRIDYDPNLVAEGDFYVQSGKDAIEEFIDNRQLDMDAIMVSNDDMAIGAIIALNQRNIRVPRDVKIIGFDDIKEIRFGASPLATVRQPITKMAEVALTTLLNHLEDKPVMRHQYLSPPLITRASCGCSNGHVSDMDNEIGYEEYPVSSSIESVLHDYINKGPYRKLKYRVAYIELLHLLLEDCTSEACVLKMMDMFDALLIQENQTEDFLTYMHKLLGFSRAQVLIRVDYLEAVRWIELFFKQSTNLVLELIQSISGLNRIIGNRNIAHLMVESIDEIAAATSLDELKDVLLKELPEVGIKSCLVNMYLFEDEEKELIYKRKLPKKSKMILGYSDQVRYEDDLIFDTSEFVPKVLELSDRPYSWLAEPLYYKDEIYGYLAYEIGAKDSMIYETIRRHISSTLHYIKLLEDK